MDDEFDESWTLILKTAMKLRDYFASSSGNKSDAVTFAQEKLLTVVMDYPDGIMLKDIASILGLTPGAVSQTLECLVKEELLERIPVPHDRRAISIHLTEKSHSMQERFSRHFNRIMASVRDKTSDKERNAFVKVLKTVFEGIESNNAASVRRPCPDAGLLEKKA